MIDDIIDVSHFDNAPDWTKVKASGIQAIIHKATQGLHYVDKTYPSAKTDVPATGMLWGAYHFGTGDGTGADQANFFLDTVQPDAQTLVSIDFEPNPSGTTMSLQQMLDWIDVVQKATGRWPVVYGGKSLLFGAIGTSQQPVLAQCPLWVAQYTTAAAPSSIPSQVWKDWTFWQYTETGKVDGIDVNVDRERFNGTAEELAAKWPF